MPGHPEGGEDGARPELRVTDTKGATLARMRGARLILWVGQCPGFVCVQTRFQRGLVTVSLRRGDRVALSGAGDP